MTLNKIRSVLEDLPLGEIRYFENLNSTNTYALEWVKEHPHELSLVVAGQQTAGYGRNQRAWHSHQAASLTFSVILYPSKEEKAHLPLFSPLAALAVCTAIERFDINKDVEVKWPNDVLVNHKKCAGILSEAVWDEADLRGLVIGIGINTGAAAIPDDKDILFPATSLETEFGAGIDKWKILHDVLQKLIELRQYKRTTTFIKQWSKRLAFIDRPVVISDPSGMKKQGILVGVDNDGNLLLNEKSGQQSSFSIGDVSLRPDS